MKHKDLLSRIYYHLIVRERDADPETQEIASRLYAEIVAALNSPPVTQPQDQQRARAQELDGLAGLAAREDIRG